MRALLQSTIDFHELAALTPTMKVALVLMLALVPTLVTVALVPQARAPLCVHSRRCFLLACDGRKSKPSGKRNKYAQFSKADAVRDSLRFSKLDQPARSSDKQPVEAAEVPRERNLWLYPDAALVDQRDPSTFGFSEVGYILGAHGVRGELRVVADSSFSEERLLRPGPVWIRKKGRRAPREVRVLSGRRGPGSNAFLLRLKGTGSREAAAALRGAALFVRRELKPELEVDEVLSWQLEGLRVALVQKSQEGEPEGQVEAHVEGEHVGVIVGMVPCEELTGDPNLGNDLLEVALGCREVRLNRDQSGTDQG